MLKPGRALFGISRSFSKNILLDKRLLQIKWVQLTN